MSDYGTRGNGRNIPTAGQVRRARKPVVSKLPKVKAGQGGYAPRKTLPSGLGAGQGRGQGGAPQRMQVVASLRSRMQGPKRPRRGLPRD